MQEDCWQGDDYAIGPIARVCLPHYMFHEHIIIILTGIFSGAKACELHSVFYWISFENFCMCWCLQIIISYCMHLVDYNNLNIIILQS